MENERPLRLLLCGALGRMGRRVTELALQDPRVRIVAGVAADPPHKHTGPFPLISLRELPRRVAEADVLIDFSVPAASIECARAAAKGRKPVVIGTTGFTPGQTASLRSLSKKTAVFLSPNFSRGINLLLRLAAQAAATLRDYDVGILDVHHAGKKDAPSGTALLLASAVRRGKPGSAIAIASQRLGAVVGDHVVTLAGPHERVELVHRTQSRDAFARGALDAAFWVRRRRPGLYDMQAMMEPA